MKSVQDKYQINLLRNDFYTNGEHILNYIKQAPKLMSTYLLKHFFNSTHFGNGYTKINEDCLYLNIYAPKVSMNK